MECVTSVPKLDGRHTYDWETMSDGQVWQLKRGEDFNCKSKSVRAAALSWAKRRGLRVKIRMIRDTDIYIQFHKDGRDELDELVR